VEFKEIFDSYSTLKQSMEKAVLELEVNRNNYNFIKEKNEKMRTLAVEHNRLKHNYDIFLNLSELLRGEKGKDNSFIDYIAEQRLKNVVLKASEILGGMTGYRYAIATDVNIGFLISDASEGGLYRSVSSLSGGETFITSLALALALSEQIQLKGKNPLEFFFLDEGFGSLDPDTLDTVTDCLEKISGRDRIIGLISHVPELRARMPRRLIVSSSRGTGKGSTAYIEYS
jgi:exonuclease SbcC